MKKTLKTQSGTRIYRLQFERKGVAEIYVVKCADSVHPNPTDILAKGLLLVVKIGMMRGVDCLGRDLTEQYGKNSGKGFNNCPKMMCGDINAQSMIATKTYATLVKEAHHIGELYRKNNPKAGISGDLEERKLPYIMQDRHNNMPILNDGEKYYIEGSVKCDCCPHMIKGVHWLSLSPHGKVISMTAFQPTEDGFTKRDGSKKYTCKDCSVGSIDPLTLSADSEAGREARRNALYMQTTGESAPTINSEEKVTLTLNLTPAMAIKVLQLIGG